METEGKLIILTGKRGAGKSTFCSVLITHFKKESWQVRGLYSPGLFVDGYKNAIEVVNLENNERRLLAVPKSKSSLSTDENKPLHWNFDPQILEWGNRILMNAVPTDLLIVDEIGPLELKLGQGWTEAINALDGKAYRLALLVMRPELLTDATQRWPWAQVYTLSSIIKVPTLMQTVLRELHFETK
jgi:nucleoside-triphosphatase